MRNRWMTGAVAACLLICVEPAVYSQDEGFPGPPAFLGPSGKPLDNDIDSDMENNESQPPAQNPDEEPGSEAPPLPAETPVVSTPEAAVDESGEPLEQPEAADLRQLQQLAEPVLFQSSVLSYQPGSALFPSLARTSLARTQAAQNAVNLNQPYNLRIGAVRVRFTAGFGIEANDNVNTSQTSPQADLIFTPALQAAAIWQLTKLNTFQVALGISYQDYLIHSAYNTHTATIAPGSQLAFDFYVGDFRFNLHDTFSLEQDPTSQATASNTSTLGLFTNDGGLTALWDLNKLILALGCEYVVTLDTSSQSGQSYGNQSSQIIPFSVTFPVSKALDVGFKGDVAFTTASNGPTTTPPAIAAIEAPPFQQRLIGFRIRPPSPPTPVFRTIRFKAPAPAPVPASLSTNATEQESRLGLFVEGRLTRFINVDFVGGYQLVSITPAGSSSTSTGAAGTQKLNGFYGTVSLTHLINRYVSQTLSLGHQTSIGVDLSAEQDTYLSHTMTWNIIKNVGLATSAFIEQVHTPAVDGAENLRRYGAVISLTYQITRKLGVNAQYQYVYKISNLPDQGYRQNRVIMDFSYQF